jgi:capsular exopolysaccharide synthesis family protein
MSIFRPGSKAGPLEIAPADEAKRVPIQREELVVVSAPKSQLAEQFRTLRNSIVALNPEGAPRTIVMTSALRGEGKSVATLNLALALAELPGVQVAVIEANLHASAVEDYLGLPRRQGLSELLSGRLPLDQALRATSMNGVSILAAGAQPRNPSELLGSDRMRTLLRTLKQRFNYVLIDTPESSTTSDASLLGAMTDGIVLVVRKGQTPKHFVDAAHNSLETMGGNVVGICLTGADLRNTA